MSKQRQNVTSLHPPAQQPMRGVVASLAAASLVTEAGHVADALCAEAAHASEHIGLAAAQTVTTSSEAAHGAQDLRAEVEADLRAYGATLAEIRSGLAFVDDQLDELESKTIRLQNYRRVQNVLAVIALVVLLCIAWNVVAR